MFICLLEQPKKPRKVEKNFFLPNIINEYININVINLY